MSHRRFAAARRLLAGASALLLLTISAGPAQAHGSFWDDDGNTHEAQIEAIEHEGITRGCNPPLNDQYCPNFEISRDQMAAFLARALGLPPAQEDHFVDDAGNIFEEDINRIAEAGITKGCNPPDNTRYCPGETVSRETMAAFLDRAFVEEETDEDFFDDDEGNQFEHHINKIAAAGITKGCNPPENTRYCPDGFVHRDEMASFVARAMHLHHPNPSAGDYDLILHYSWGTEGDPEEGDVRVFGTRIHEALHSQATLGTDGWNIQQRIFFVPVRSGGDFHLWLTDDDDVGDKAPVCSDEWSCTVGDDLYINDDNFANATETWAHRDLADYQRYVINHEVGHYLNFDRRSHYNDPAYCGTAGEAPVMMQQSIDLNGCHTNVWPLGWERDCVEETWLTDEVNQGGELGQCPHEPG